MGRSPESQMVSRRFVLRGLGTTLALAPLSRLLGCGSTSLGTTDAGPDAPGAVGDAAASDVTTAADTVASDVVASDAGVGAWATGGTAAMTGAGSYPDPFVGVSPTACSLICETTIGPCHTTSPERADVSEGLDGIPLRLALRVLNEACAPVANAIVEIWQTNHPGIYSGNVNQICNSAAADRAATYFRGFLRTDATGRVDFNTCFPGWYRGRAIHIHVRIMTGEYAAADNAQASVITQVVFSDDLVREVFTDVPLYAARGLPDTLLPADYIVGAIADRSPYVLDVARMPDGAMLASKTLVVRASLSTPVCSVGGMPGGGG